jgi:acetyl esterase/lipase
MILATIVLVLLAAGPGIAQSQTAVSVHGRRLAPSLPLSKFYDTPDPLPAGNPGELIRSAEFDGYNLPLGVSAIRLLYHSRSAINNDVSVSAVALVPDGKAPAGGWPVIAWAHELNGVARDCAPSLARNLEHGPFLSMYVQLGYAVVATDYAGLGTKFRNAFADTPSNALDVIYSVAAARQALPQLGSRWVAIGTGEGARSVVAVTELESEMRDPNYLGGATLSPLLDLDDVYASPAGVDYKLPLFLAYGIRTVFPKFEVKDILTDEALPLYEEVARGCNQNKQFDEPSAGKMLRPEWRNNAQVQNYLGRNRVGLKQADRPLLVIGSESDPSIAKTTTVVKRLCKQGDQVQFKKYPESDPGRVIGDSTRDQIAWIQGRFAGRRAPSNCSP